MAEEKLDSPTRRSGISLPVTVALVVVAAVVGAVAAVTVQNVEARSPEAAAVAAADTAEKTAPVQDEAAESTETEAERVQPAPESWQAEPLDDPFEQLFGSSEWDPFQEMQAMRERMEMMFNESLMRLNQSPLRNFSTPGARLTTAPSVDLTDHEDAYVVHVDMPGLEDGNANVTLEGQQLSISGSRVDVVEDTQGGQMLRQERRATHFARSLTLPGPVDPDGMTTSYEDGVLTIRIPKQQGSMTSPGDTDPI